MAEWPAAKSERSLATSKQAIMNVRAEYLRAVEIARLTGVSIRTVRRWIADEIIPSTKLGGARLVSTLPRPLRKPQRTTMNNLEKQATIALSGKLMQEQVPSIL